MPDKIIREKLKEEIEMPDIVKERINFTLNDIRLTKFGTDKEVIKMKRKPFYRKGIVAAACVLLISSATVVTAAVINWNPIVIEKFNISDDTQTELSNTGVVSVPELSVECNQTTISMEQCLTDNNFLYFLFKITVPENIIITENTGFNQITLTENDDDSAFNWCGGILYSEKDDNLVIDNETHTFYYEISGERTEAGSYEGSEINISFSGLENYDIKTDTTESLATGEWNFTWTETEVDVMKEYTCNVPLKNTSATVKSITISPISATVLYDYPKTPEILEALNTLDPSGEPPAITAFELNDGTLLEISDGLGIMGYVSEDSNDYEASSMFENRIVNPQEIIAVYFEGERVPLN